MRGDGRSRLLGHGSVRKGVCVNGKHSETDIKWNTDQPVWNQDMSFGTQPVGAMVNLYLYDYDQRNYFNDGPDSMGITSFSVEKTGEIVTSVASTQGEGTIKLRLTFVRPVRCPRPCAPRRRHYVVL